MNTAQKAGAAAAAAAAQGGGAAAADPTHCFEIRTANVDFYVGDTTPNEARNSGMGVEIARGWEIALRQALMPVVQASVPGQGGAEDEPKSSAAAATAAVEAKKAEAAARQEAAQAAIAERKETDISQLYQVRNQKLRSTQSWI